MLALVRDLMFVSRISATARAAGVAVRVVRNPERLAAEATDPPPGNAETGVALIVDLSLPGAIEAATEWKQRTAGRVVGFVSHVDAATIRAAREAGLDQVLPRSRFVEVLPELLEYARRSQGKQTG